MIKHCDLNPAVIGELIRQKAIILGGNRKLNIYGTLHCGSGKRMKKENRVFFASEQEAIDQGYRPCGNCMRKEYLKYLESKNGPI